MTAWHRSLDHALHQSQSAFVRGFIDDSRLRIQQLDDFAQSQSAFVRGFIDDEAKKSSFTIVSKSQSAFVRGFIDDVVPDGVKSPEDFVSIRVRARLHR